MLTEKEEKLLREIKKNSRASLSEISKNTNIPISTLFETLKKLNNTIITKNICLLDYNKLGYPLNVHFEIETKNKEQMNRFLKQNRNVNNTYLSANGPDIYAECIFKDFSQLIELKEKLDSMDSTSYKETFIVDEIKKETFLTESSPK